MYYLTLRNITQNSRYKKGRLQKRETISQVNNLGMIAGRNGLTRAENGREDLAAETGRLFQE